MKGVKVLVAALLAILLIGYLIPDPHRVPVMGATERDWNHDTFWFGPWGASGVHKGIDIFGPMGVGVISAGPGLVVYTGSFSRGGRVVIVLGPKWRFHYYAHLSTIETSAPSLIRSGDRIGTLGDSGNARGKPPHLHYAILRLLPAPWAMDDDPQGYKKAFYVDPDAYLRGSGASVR